MAYLRTKSIGGHTYYYLVEGRRVGNKVVQRHVRYIGSALVVRRKLSAPSRSGIPRFREQVARELGGLGKGLVKDLYHATLQIISGQPSPRRKTKGTRRRTYRGKPRTLGQLFRRELGALGTHAMKAVIELLIPSPKPKRKRAQWH